MIYVRFILAMLAICFFASPSPAGGHRVVQRQVVYPYYVAPQVNYFVGAPIRVEAIVQKALRDDPDYQAFQQFKTWKALAANAHEPPVNEGPQPAKLFACAQCHSGDKPKGGLLLDGSAPLTAAQALRAMNAVRDGVMPPKKKLTPEEAGEVFNELLDLSLEK